MNQVGKHMDVVPPLGWNWTADDWRIFNFCRDLDFRGGCNRTGHWGLLRPGSQM